MEGDSAQEVGGGHELYGHERQGSGYDPGAAGHELQGRALAPDVPQFQKFDSIPRLRREMIVTEKLDGTNAQITILEDGRVLAGSRTRFITPTDDNFGFAAWVWAHETELREGLGMGTHHGEWWGLGIQRGYGVKEKRFSLFNVSRWGKYRDRVKYPKDKPACCFVVPILYRGLFDTASIEVTIHRLRKWGSAAAPGFMHPEGVVVYHTKSDYLFKQSIEKDEEPKGLAMAQAMAKAARRSVTRKMAEGA